MKYLIFDIETNGLLNTKNAPVVTKIHCFSYIKYTNGIRETGTFVEYGEIIDFLYSHKEYALVGHKIITYDVPVLEKILGINLSDYRQIDTLALSWYLYPTEHEHGLEYWGEKLGIAKPKVTDWQNDTIEVYIVRCQEDCKINDAFFLNIISYLKILYEGSIDRILDYLTFKLQCAREQEEQRWKLDVERCKKNLDKLLLERAEKVKKLTALMPKVTKYKKVPRPKVCFKKDGSLSVHGTNWFTLLWEMSLPNTYLGIVNVPIDYEDGNPGSHQQMKDWLFSLGWQPLNIKIDKKPTGEIKRIPQIANQDGNDVCESVKALYDKVPDLVELEGLYVIRHRIGLLEGFLNNEQDGYLMAQISGLTNTLRFKHTVLVNLPTIPKPYWEEVRGCLIAEDDHILCGSDMSSLEDNTKQHYMMYFDPEYVKQMRTPGFDPHIDISVRAKAMSYDEGEFYKWYDNKKDGKVYEYTPTTEFEPTTNSVLEGHSKNLPFSILKDLDSETQAKIIKILKPIRLKMKKGNFASVYGAGIAKLAITLGVSEAEAKKFHTAYWVRNKSVKDVANACIVKKIGSQMWLYNPVSTFWYSLREEKDKFSTLNQGTGVYCFDTWLMYVRKQRIKLIAQFHDEKVSRLKPEQKDEWKEKLTKAIEQTNQEVRLQVPLKISVDFGKSYADIH